MKEVYALLYFFGERRVEREKEENKERGEDARWQPNEKLKLKCLEGENGGMGEGKET